ncbi:uncharacterized protein METZ01_LOCUS195924 [marine metagenome]|jgi:hypothetical protein|uniref:Uncharacterized protein n=1 Tax=marine metagenome TaxID=408172 RepID=A0A382DX97_9ZZZZ
MDIISAAQSKLRSTLNEATFELNSCLDQPAVNGSLDRFSEAIQKYTCTLMQLETLFKLQQQTQKAEGLEENET